MGDLLLDIIVQPDRAPSARDEDTPARIRLGAGGQAANVAAWTSVLGATSRLICKRGTDLPAKIATSEVESYGVQVTGPVVAGDSGVVVSLVGLDGTRTMLSDRRASSTLEPGDVDLAWLRDCEMLYVSGYCLFDEAGAAAAVKAASVAPRVAIDLSTAAGIRAVGVPTFQDRVQALHPDLIFATSPERAAMAGFDATWVTKLGPDGAIFPEGSFGSRADHPVDTTGAGDALAAGYLIGGPELAMAAAARCAQLVGAMPADSRHQRHH